MSVCMSPNFLNPPAELADVDTCPARILPIPLDITASWKRGTAEGPGAIISASHHIEYYDDELDLSPVEVIGGIATLPALELPVEPQEAMQAIEEAAAGYIREDRLLISLGGEHSITAPLVSSHKQLWPDLCVLQIDAHADLRDSYMDSPHNHACPMRRIKEMGVHVSAVGIRSVDETEALILNGKLRRTFLDCETNGRIIEIIPDIVASLPGENVYLTIDLDGLDPAVVPAVGTPIPGGLSWYETLGLVRAVATRKRIIGADVVELMPREGLHCSDSTAARLVYKIIAYTLTGNSSQ